MNTTSMLKEMCSHALSATDIKAICKHRGFPEKAISSRSVFESYFLSTLGLESVLPTLNKEGSIFLHLLKLEQKAVDLRFFESLCNETRNHAKMTFTQRYSPVFKHIQKSLIRKGTLLMAETDAGSSKMERLRFRFPHEFDSYLPPLLERTVSFQGKGNVRQEAMRTKLMEFTNPNVHSLSGYPDSMRVVLRSGELHMGDDKMSVELLEKWQQESWNELVWQSHQKHSESLKSKRSKRYHYYKMHHALTAENKPFPAILNYAFSSLSPDEWAHSESLSLLLKHVYFGTIPPDPSLICEIGWQQGALAMHTSEGEKYYRLPGGSQEERDPSSYLTVEDSSLILDSQTIPYESLIHIAAISKLDVNNRKVSAIPDTIRLGKVDAGFLEQPVLQWLKKNSVLYKKAITQVESRRGQQIIHENLLLAKIRDLSLKIQIQKKFSDPSQVIMLPNDFIAFPSGLMPEISKLLTNSGFVVKTISANDQHSTDSH